MSISQNSRYYGFNFLWMFSSPGKGKRKNPAIDIAYKELDFIADMGCNFVRLPLDYRFWIHDFCYSEPDELMLKMVDRCVEAVTERGFHCSLNLHRAPGYCINGAELEKHNLWLDAEAQDAFILQWQLFAERFATYNEAVLSFDLLNEPPNIGQYGMTRAIHKDLMERTVAAIRAISPHRPITLDGLGGGNIAMPELAHLDISMSTRGYQPMALTHYKAAWCNETQGLPRPIYPGTEYGGLIWNRGSLLKHYEPWALLSRQGIPVHVGEFGCYNRIDNKTALLWFKDILSVFHELGWGYSLWNLIGDFGIIGHNRPGTRWERIHGFYVDRELYELFRMYMKKE